MSDIVSGARWRRKSDGIEVEVEGEPQDGLLRIKTRDLNPNEGTQVTEELLRADYEPVPAEDEMPVYDRDHLPEDFMVPGGASWGEFVLIEPLRAIEVAGAFQVRLPLEHALRDTVGVLTYPSGGWVVIDERGDPVGIDPVQFRSLYRPTQGTETRRPAEGLPMEGPDGIVMHDITDGDGKPVGTIVLDEPLTTEQLWDFAITPMVATGFDTEEGVDTVALKGWLASSRTTLDVRHREQEPPYDYFGPSPNEEMLFARLAEYVEKQGGSIGCGYDKGEWSVSVMFGEEEPGSPMVAGAAHGLSKSLHAALEQAASECGLLK